MKYMVKNGDALGDLAREFNTTVLDIKMENKLLCDTVHAGQQLEIYLYNLPKGVYGNGSKGADVRNIQKVLRELGFYSFISGVYDENTAYIIKSIQLKYPEYLNADGIYGPKTREFLERLLLSGYSVIKNPSNILVLVNKKNGLLPSYAPRDLVLPQVPFPFAGFLPQKQMRKEAARAMEKLFTGAGNDGISLYAVSGYRSFLKQASIFAEYALKDTGANKYSARPAESEHQTGLCMDISCPQVDYDLVEEFADTDVWVWLSDNAHKYGFIIRYPKGKEDITGYQFEPWHIRYVGQDAANEIAEQRITLEEHINLKNIG